MKSITKILMLITLFVAGCSADRCYWYQPGATLKQARKDCRDCYCEALNDELKVDVQYESSRHVSVYDHDPEYLPYFDDVITLHELNLQNATRGCMKRKGYCLTRASEVGSEVQRKTTCAFGECFPIAGR
jgi:hypothetical protein